jgi:alpha-D-ribose 1-methylphosphonate 5-triphosphate synthase subunit PhnL
MAPILSVRSLSKTFTMHLLGGKIITPLRNVEFDVEPGEFIAIIGRTGSGKSTLLKSICGIYPPSHGTITYRGVAGEIELGAADDIEIASLRGREIGYVAQHLQVIPRISAVDIAAEPLLICGEPLEAARAAARRTLLAMSLPEHLHEVFPSTFSLGERQRLNIARAVVVRPRLLLLDEPTAALDPLTRDVVVEALKAMSCEGVSIIGIFHDFEVVARLAHRVIHLDDGKIMCVGHPREVLPRYLQH